MLQSPLETLTTDQTRAVQQLTVHQLGCSVLWHHQNSSPCLFSCFWNLKDQPSEACSPLWYFEDFDAPNFCTNSSHNFLVCEPPQKIILWPRNHGKLIPFAKSTRIFPQQKRKRPFPLEYCHCQWQLEDSSMGEQDNHCAFFVVLVWLISSHILINQQTRGHWEKVSILQTNQVTPMQPLTYIVADRHQLEAVDVLVHW